VSANPDELEVLLPPGLVLRFTGTSEQLLRGTNHTVHHYLAVQSGIPETPVTAAFATLIDPSAIEMLTDPPALVAVATV
jgi:hypothetical protein